MTRGILTLARMVRSFGCTAILTTALAGAANAVQILETFDSEPASWVGVDNRTAPQDYGWIDTNIAGGDVGEVGGLFSRENPASYYSTDIGSLDLSTDSFTVKGKGFILSNQPNAMVGYFDSTTDLVFVPDNFLGFFIDTGTIYTVGEANGTGGVIPVTNLGVPGVGVAYTFEMNYDPNANDGNGTITYIVDGGEPQVKNLAADRKNDYTLLDRFGILSENAPGGGSPGEMYFDDLEYTSAGAVSALIGDYNENDVVDAADYVVWRKNNGTSNSLPNRDPDATGDIGQADYDAWLAAFGNASAAGSLVQSAGVPEPGALLLAVIAVVGLPWRQRSWRR